MLLSQRYAALDTSAEQLLGVDNVLHRVLSDPSSGLGVQVQTMAYRSLHVSLTQRVDEDSDDDDEEGDEVSEAEVFWDSHNVRECEHRRESVYALHPEDLAALVSLARSGDAHLGFSPAEYFPKGQGYSLLMAERRNGCLRRPGIPTMWILPAHSAAFLPRESLLCASPSRLTSADALAVGSGCA
jgi:hypothetical protein